MPESMKIDDTSRHIYRPFLNFLCDAIRFAVFAEQTADDQSQAAALARGSLLNTMLGLEFAADSFMKAAVTSARLARDVERLPTMSKFEIGLQFARPGAKFHRGVTQIQKMQELVQLRNRQVHAKSEVRAFRLRSTESGVAKLEFAEDLPPNNVISIPHDSEKWYHEHAVFGLQALDEGLYFIFVELARMKPGQVNEFLANCIKSDGKTAILSPGHRDAEYLKLGKIKWGIQTAYLEF